jgi:surface protein
MAFSAVANDIPERLTKPKGEHVYLPDPDKLFEDSAATTPASVGGPVGAWEDQSGNHTATQSTTANKPTLRQDANGQYYVEFVPNEDFLETGVSSTNATKVSAIPGVGAFSAETKPGNKSRTNARIQSTTAGAIVKEGSLTDSHRASLAAALDQRGKDVADSVTSFEDYFRNEPLTHYDAHAQDTSQVTNMSIMFLRTSVSDLSLSGWDTSSVTNMKSMFSRTNVSDLSPLSGWDTSSVTDMRFIFDFTSVSDLSPLSGWDTSQVTNMGGMFQNTSVSDLSPISAWDVANVTNFGRFLENAPLDDVPTGDMLDGWTDGSPNTASDMQSGVTLGIDSADYNNMDSGGQAAVDALCSNQNWTINATNAPADCS